MSGLYTLQFYILKKLPYNNSVKTAIEKWFHLFTGNNSSDSSSQDNEVKTGNMCRHRLSIQVYCAFLHVANFTIVSASVDPHFFSHPPCPLYLFYTETRVGQSFQFILYRYIVVMHSISYGPEVFHFCCLQGP